MATNSAAIGNINIALPALTKRNARTWIATIEDAAIALDIEDQIKQNPTEVTDATERKRVKRAMAQLRSYVLASIPEILQARILPIGPIPQIHEILSNVQSVLCTDSPEEHAILRYEAEALLCHEDLALQHFFSKHEDIRPRMIATGYPLIAHKSTYVDIMLKCLASNPQFEIARRIWSVSKPSSFIALKQAALAYDAELKAENARGATHMNNLGAPSLAGTRTFPRRGPPTQRPLQYRCNFHAALGVPSTHTDQQCRDPRNPIGFYAQRGTAFPPTQATAPQRGQPRPRKTRKRHPAMRPVAAAAQILPFRPHIAPVAEQQIPHMYDMPIEQQEEEHDDQGKFALDSAAHPSYLAKLQLTTKRLPYELATITATNDVRPSTHFVTATIAAYPRIIETTVVVTPSINPNIISVHDMAQRYGCVIFTRHRAAIVSPRECPAKLVATARWSGNQYLLDTKLTRSAACGARTFTKSARATKSSAQKVQPRRLAHEPSLPVNAKIVNHNQNTAAEKKTSAKLAQRQLSKMRGLLPVPALVPIPDERISLTSRWHLILNHAPGTKISQIAKSRAIRNMPPSLGHSLPLLTCSACAQGSTPSAPHRKCKEHNYKVGQFISSDTCGPINPASTEGFRHFVTFLDAHSRYASVVFIRTRAQVPDAVHTGLELAAKQCGTAVHIFLTDNAREYLTNSIRTYYAANGITKRETVPHCPQENSLAERLNRTIVNAARCNLSHANLPAIFWPAAIADAVYKYNLMPHSATGASPHNKWFGRPARPARLFSFGQFGTVPVHAPKRKLDPRGQAIRYMFGVNETQVMVLNLTAGKMKLCRAVDFRPYYSDTDPVLIARSVRTNKLMHTCPPPARVDIDTPPPISLPQARRYPDAAEWAVAHDAELDQLDNSNTFQWIPSLSTPSACKPIPLTFSYRYKWSQDGQVVQRKARCSLRGDFMKPLIHYDPEQKSAFMADKATVRLIFALAAANRQRLAHFDLKSAYTTEPADESWPIHVRQPPRFDGSHKHDVVVGKLRRNLNGGPTAFRHYQNGLHLHLTNNGLRRSQHDPCLYVASRADSPLVVATCGDDFLVTAPDAADIRHFHKILAARYKVKDLGEPSLFLGWKVLRTEDGAVHLSQPHPVLALLKRLNMLNALPRKTPLPHKPFLDEQASKTPLEDPQQKIYRQTVGELRYLADSTRIDIAHAVGTLAVFIRKPTQQHWWLLKHVLRYIRGAIHTGILYQAHNESSALLTAYADSDFAQAADRRSITGFVALIAQAPITWISRKQQTVALSTCEAEYVAASQALQEMLCLRRMLIDIYPQLYGQAIPLRLDNQSAIMIGKAVAPTKRRKHIDVKHHHIVDHQQRGTISLQHVESARNLADPCTKQLAQPVYQQIMQALNVMSQTPVVGTPGADGGPKQSCADNNSHTA